jgi:hypothetical protein
MYYTVSELVQISKSYVLSAFFMGAKLDLSSKRRTKIDGNW